jgi:uncharacterized protein YjiS (DUF1127 family)
MRIDVLGTIARITLLDERLSTPTTSATTLRGSLPALARAALRCLRRYQRRREARAIRGALSDLDDHTLRDLGFHRSEIGSVAAEATGLAERTRMRTLLRPRAPG